MIETAEQFFPDPKCPRNNKPIQSDISYDQLQQLRREKTIFIYCPAGKKIQVDWMVLDNEEVYRFRCTNCRFEDLF